MQFHNEVRPVCTATAAQLWLLFASYVSFNPLMFSLFLFYSLLYYFLSVFWACSFFLLSACFFGEETFRTLAGNQGWPFCSLLRPVRSKAAARCFRLCGPRACPHRRALTRPRPLFPALLVLPQRLLTVIFLPDLTVSRRPQPLLFQARAQPRSPPCPAPAPCAVRLQRSVCVLDSRGLSARDLSSGGGLSPSYPEAELTGQECFMACTLISQESPSCLPCSRKSVN